MSRIFVCLCLVLSAALIKAQNPQPLTLTRTIALPGVTGKFDHFALDEKANRLFVAATGSHTVLVIDLANGKILQSLTGMGKPHGLAWIAETDRLFVADGDRAELAVYEGSPFKLVKSIKLSEDADDMVYDAAHKLLYVGHGGTDAANPAAVAVVDAAGLTLVSSLSTSAHPEALEIDEESDRIFVNISDSGEVIVIDGKTHTIADTWKLVGMKGNTPLAFDAEDKVLLVACRTPAKLLALSSVTGKQLDAAVSDGGADDLFYDQASRRAYLIAGSGVVNSYAVAANGGLTPLASTKTLQGAKTGLFATAQATLFVGVPASAGSSEIRVYKTEGH